MKSIDSFNQKLVTLIDPFNQKLATLHNLKKLAADKTVCIIGSVPPQKQKENRTNPDYLAYLKADIVIRCNDWWAYDEGRCDIWFYIGASDKLKETWFLKQTVFRENLKLICLYADGMNAKTVKQQADFSNIPVLFYHKETSFLKPLRTWFELRGTSPSTGLTAIYTLSLCKPKELFITGMDLYAFEPKHVGWHRHNPIGHCYWIKKLMAENDFITIGQDLQNGINHWSTKDEGFSA